ncbi:hypothetical protein DERP_012492 [Dermatophagoides pteronyssinus]|uniref:Uncharacterized protein n=1 Tax=Dermatophagoides pteronyssinus TaxID=6956 RepID=A0ABQ8IXA3_DERPT|nr:hypothetical protein DERP_012492 [Dermatophagoides pteronyssinus]
MEQTLLIRFIRYLFQWPLSLIINFQSSSLSMSATTTTTTMMKNLKLSILLIIIIMIIKVMTITAKISSSFHNNDDYHCDNCQIMKNRHFVMKIDKNDRSADNHWPPPPLDHQQSHQTFNQIKNNFTFSFFTNRPPSSSSSVTSSSSFSDNIENIVFVHHNLPPLPPTTTTHHHYPLTINCTIIIL